MTQRTASPCYLCNSSDTELFFELPNVPTMDGVLWPSKQAALQAPKGDIRLQFCRSCGYIGNEGYEQEKVQFDHYDFSLKHSPLFVSYINSLADRLIERYGLRHKCVLDVGCGDGHFLETICERGPNKGIGIDPGYKREAMQLPVGLGVEYLQDYYTGAYAQLKPDLVANRLVIDLLGDPRAFLEIFYHNLKDKPETILYFEVPYANYTFGEKIIWNIVYEHRSWFTPQSFRYLFESAGFEVLEVAPCWNDEFLGIEARINPAGPQQEVQVSAEEIGQLSKMVGEFARDANKLMQSWQLQLSALQDHQKTVLWGAGARGVTFLNVFDLKEQVAFAVDINPKRQGEHLAGSGHKVEAPEYLQHYQPELIIISNPTYAHEIQQQARGLGLDAEFMVL
ncbi:MAG: methyltransferase domain-containing protein [Bacteroidetes bacterium]|nr:MAG: methyltransferase domain-containing protein [Bacteroidota bacterium]